MSISKIARRLIGAAILSMLVACSSGVEAAALSSPVAQAADAFVLAEDHASPEDYQWDSANVTAITFNGDSITAAGDGAVVNGSTVMITAAGAYSLAGSLADGQVIINTEESGLVQLILNGVQLSSSTSAPLYIQKAEETVIILAENTTSHVSDASTYVYAAADEDEPNAAIFSKGNLTLAGSGALTVAGNYNDGIASKDGLVLDGAAITVTAVDDGIRGKDYLVVKAGSVTVTAGGDGLKSDNAEDAGMGYIAVDSGKLNITASGDALTAETSVVITDGDFMLVSGGGHTVFLDDSTSAKGIKGTAGVQIDGGAFVVDAADDAIHSNGSLVVNGGTFTLATGDDGMHADATLTINGGDINITQSYEGIESAVITIQAGTIRLAASDDGLNVAGGNDAAGAAVPQGPRQGRGGNRGQDMFAASGDYWLYINGGYITVDALGDGIDVNGAIEMTGGTVIVNGPTENMNAALDYDGGFKISGGLLVAVGSAGMAQAPDTSSTQNSVLLNLTSPLPAGTLISLQSSGGQSIVTIVPAKTSQSILVSSPQFVTGATYTLYAGGSSTGTLQDSLYTSGVYTPGTEVTSVTLSGVVTLIGGGRFR